MDRFGCGLVLAVCVLIAVSGCRPSGPATVPVTGTVLYNGKPLDGASVTFTPDNAALAASGMTDAQGKFTLSTMGKGGAVVGKHAVTVAKSAAAAATLSEEEAKKGPEAMTKMYTAMQEKKAGSPIPEKYSRPADSGFSAVVEAGKTNDFTFELKD